MGKKRKFSYNERYAHYVGIVKKAIKKKGINGKFSSREDYAEGYALGMTGGQNIGLESSSAQAGYNAGQKFKEKLENCKL